MAAASRCAMRSLDNALETEGPQKKLSGRSNRRVNCALLTGSFRATSRNRAASLKVFGQSELARQFINDIEPRLRSLGLSLEERPSAPPRPRLTARFPTKPSPPRPWPSLPPGSEASTPSPTFCRPKSAQPGSNLLPTRASSQRLAWAGGAVGFAVLCLGATFGVQQWHIYNLQSEYDKMKPRLDAIDDAQKANLQVRRLV